MYIFFDYTFLPRFTEVFKFTCPEVGEKEAQQHPRYADPEDCQFFYVCIDGKVPRRNGCKKGQVFNDVTRNCDWPRNVAEWFVSQYFSHFWVCIRQSENLSNESNNVGLVGLWGAWKYTQGKIDTFTWIQKTLTDSSKMQVAIFGLMLKSIHKKKAEGLSITEPWV